MRSFKKKILLSVFFQKIILVPLVLANEEDFSAPTIQIKLSELQQELQQLNGKLEETNHRLQQLEKKIDLSVADTEVRFQDKSPSLENLLSPEQVFPAANLQEEYERAIQLLRAGEYDRARILLEAFIKNHPKDDLVIQAHYWCGMTYFLEKDYKKAAEIFATNYQKYPKSPKMLDSLLKLAQSLKALGKTKDACTTLDELLSLIPGKKIPLMEEAKKEREALGCSR